MSAQMLPTDENYGARPREQSPCELLVLSRDLEAWRGLLPGSEQPNERWQADFTHWWLADHTHVEILDFVDAHARYALSVTAHRCVTGPIVLAQFRKAVAVHGVPASTLTDGMVFTTRLSGGKGGRNSFETNYAA